MESWKDKTNIKQIFLIINTGYFGDVLLTSKLTRDIKKEYPNSLLVFIVDTPYESVAKCLPGVDEVICYDRKKCHNIFNFIKFLLSFPYMFKVDFAFLPYGTKTNRRILASALGVKKIFKLYKFQQKPIYKRFIVQNPLNQRYTCGAANMLSCLTDKPTDEQDIEYIVPKFAEEKIDKYLNNLGLQNNLIAINPMAGDSWKCWDVDEVVKFAKMVMKDGKKIVLTGVLKDGTECMKALDEHIGAENYLNLVGKTSIPELGALYKRCQAVVSVDTGSMHMACAVGAYTVALFFKDNYHYWGPLNIKKNSCIYNPEGIGAEYVYKEIQKFLIRKNAA